ncbi:hypothetical protein JCM19037_4168 [Geomicrobium sp. JCM 19037]|uniref:hypothetical protein n=1 Tax=Geomicrobium sp. JCM 19037 TaxID=1460634 RepID=UPI00045F3F58|nr:hypothetical protein [Geomicrobium sp. JCM 19037]GAK05650.1 hypothetical protein JCM19037_4168 [Geomicrobium sp. JCM 19037]
MNIIMNIHDEEDLGLTLKYMILELAKDLDITSLNDVVVSEDISKDVIDFQEKYLQDGQSGHRSGEIAGKVISYPLNHKFSQAMFLNSEIVNDLNSDDVWKQGRAQHFIHHELVHVYDNQNTEAFFTNILNECNHPVKFGIYSLIEIIWGEYIANVLSSPTANKYVIYDSKVELEYQIDKFNSEVSEIKEGFLIHQDNDKCLQELVLSTDGILYRVAHLLGYDHFYEMDISYNDPILNRFLNEFGEILKELYVSYPNWGSQSVLDSMFYCILSFWEEIGFDLKYK